MGEVKETGPGGRVPDYILLSQDVEREISIEKFLLARIQSSHQTIPFFAKIPLSLLLLQSVELI